MHSKSTFPLPLRERARERGAITRERSERLNSTPKIAVVYGFIG